MNWDDTRDFLAVARRGTLSGAAGDLETSIATLSRRIERLERSLKLTLFVRHQTGYRLTREGIDLVEKAEVLERAALALIDEADRHARVEGRVRLATAENFATALLLPELPVLRTRYPSLELELVTDIATTNLHRRDADLALRVVRPERGNVTLRRVGTLGYGVYASPAYMAQRETARQPGVSVSAEAAREGAEWFIGWDESYAHLPASRWLSQRQGGGSLALTTTSLSAQVSAAKAGLGLAVLPHFLARESGLVCREDAPTLDQPIYLVIHADLVSAPRIRAVADFLLELVTRNATRLERGE
ncbi:LysR family transcriptional regulator [Salinicola halophilus]|uniref:LysR family transcriptional regulator n=1 Tax=Salinicola halophilus TaxID=184065 RepID=UPI000DA1484A|nr:LysR family transcriptional regulator [Salinicola halophilus]